MLGREGLGAVGAGEWSLVGVGAQVGHEPGANGEVSGTLIALKVHFCEGICVVG